MWETEEILFVINFPLLALYIFIYERGLEQHLKLMGRVVSLKAVRGVFTERIIKGDKNDIVNKYQKKCEIYGFACSILIIFNIFIWGYFFEGQPVVGFLVTHFLILILIPIFKIYWQIRKFRQAANFNDGQKTI